MWKKFSRWVGCHVMGLHEWTCDASQNIPPTPFTGKESDQEIIQAFKNYSKMYCRHCGKLSKLNNRF